MFTRTDKNTGIEITYYNPAEAVRQFMEDFRISENTAKVRLFDVLTRSNKIWQNINTAWEKANSNG